MLVAQAVLFYAALLVCGGAGAAGDIWLYRWATSYQARWLAAGLFSWLVSLIVFGLLLRHAERSLGVTFVLAAVVHIVAVLGWEWRNAHSHLSWLESTGIVLAIVGVVLIEFGQYSAGAKG
jgi:drug/metabolite transporter superfamily protein YnfA